MLLMEIQLSQERGKKKRKQRNEKNHFRSKAHKRLSIFKVKDPISQCAYNKKVWRFLDGSIQNRKTQSLGCLTYSVNCI